MGGAINTSLLTTANMAVSPQALFGVILLTAISMSTTIIGLLSLREILPEVITPEVVNRITDLVANLANIIEGGFNLHINPIFTDMGNLLGETNYNLRGWYHNGNWNITDDVYTGILRLNNDLIAHYANLQNLLVNLNELTRRTEEGSRFWADHPELFRNFERVHHISLSSSNLVNFLIGQSWSVLWVTRNYLSRHPR